MLKRATYEERVAYLKLWGQPHTSPRSISQSFYKHRLWLDTREAIIKRDMGSDLGMFGVYIYGPILVHHINPINQEDIERWSEKLFDPENLISTSINTHNRIHYVPKDLPYVERQSGDTKLW